MARDRPPESPWGLVLVGSILAAVGGLSLGNDGPGWLGYGLLWLGAVLTLVGVVGAGIVLGNARITRPR